MHKLSAAQKKMLDRLASGEVIAYMAGYNRAAFYRESPGHETANLNTLDALEKMGLVTEINKDWRGCDYVISEAGKVASKGA